MHGAARNEEEVRGVGLGDEAARVEHERIVGARRVGFELREDRCELVARVDGLIEHIGRRPAVCGRLERDAGLVVHGRLVLGGDDERVSVRVDARVEAGCVLLAAGEREPDVNPVAHRVSFERATKLPGDLFVRWDALVSERPGRAAETGEVFPKPEDAPLYPDPTIIEKSVGEEFYIDSDKGG